MGSWSFMRMCVWDGGGLGGDRASWPPAPPSLIRGPLKAPPHPPTLPIPPLASVPLSAHLHAVACRRQKSGLKVQTTKKEKEHCHKFKSCVKKYIKKFKQQSAPPPREEGPNYTGRLDALLEQEVDMGCRICGRGVRGGWDSGRGTWGGGCRDGGEALGCVPRARAVGDCRRIRRTSSLAGAGSPFPSSLQTSLSYERLVQSRRRRRGRGTKGQRQRSWAEGQLSHSHHLGHF